MKRSVLKSGLLMAGLVCSLVFPGSRLSAQELAAARSLTRSEAYDKAGEAFKQLIQKEPGNGKNYFFYGENWLQDYFSDTVSNSLVNYTRDAKVLFDKGVSTAPAEPLNYVGLARVAFFNGDNQTANAMRAKAKSFLLPYKNIKKMTPPAADYAFILAKIAESYISVDLRNVDTAQALPLLRQAVKIDSRNPDIYLIAGDIFNIKNDGSNSIKNYNLAQEYNPTSPTAAMKIGSIYVRAKNLTAAIPYFEEAIKLNANYAPAYRELGALYSMARRYDEAKKYFEKYLELTQGNIPAKISYVRSLYFAGEYDEVIKNVEDILAVDKSRAYLNRLAGYSAFEKKDADYLKAQHYMEALFETAAPELIIKRDHTYMAKILLRKNQKYNTNITDRDRYKAQLEREAPRYAAATAANKAKLKPVVDTLSARVARLDKQIAEADKDIDRAFVEYSKALSYDPDDMALLSEIANAYYTNRRYDNAARTWSKLIALGRNDVNSYMQVGRAFYVAENYKAADSIFALVISKDPNYLPAYVYTARTYSRKESDIKEGLAQPKFEKVIAVATADTIKNISELMEAYGYLGYHNYVTENYTDARKYYSRMITLDPTNRDNKTKGYIGLAQIETAIAGREKTIESKLPPLARAQDNYNKILAYDPTNESVKASMKYVQDYEKSIRAGINPNELKGTIKNSAGQPVANASVRVKDTAAETYSNATGAFRFEIPMASEALVITAPGYKPKEVPVVRPLKAVTIVIEK